MPRTDIETIKLQGNSSNLKRALKRGPQKGLAKREELEAVFSNVQERYALALAAVKSEGAVIWQDCWKGPKVIRVQVLNPNLKVAQQCERQLLALAKSLTTVSDKQKAADEFADEFADVFEEFDEGPNTTASSN